MPTFTTTPNSNYLSVLSPIIYEFTSTDSSELAIVTIEGVNYEVLKGGSSFYFNAQDALFNALEFNFRDALNEPATTPIIRTDSSLSKEVSIRFTVGSDVSDVNITCFASAIQVGSPLLTASNQVVRLVLKNRLPITIGGYNELSLYNISSSTINRGGLSLESEVVSRCPFTDLSRAGNIRNRFGIELFENPNPSDGLEIKYFSSVGTWIYLTSLCNYEESYDTEVSQVNPTRFENPNIATSNFTYTKPRRNRFIRLGMRVNEKLYDYVIDLINSRVVFLKEDGVWKLGQIVGNQVGSDPDKIGTATLEIRMSEIFN